MWGVALCSGLLLGVSCSSDDNRVPELPEEEVVTPPEEPKAKATVKITVGEVTPATFVLRVDGEHAKSVYYLVYEKPEQAKVYTGEEIFKVGNAVEKLGEDFVVGDLTAGTTYYITAAAKNEEDAITVVKEVAVVTTEAAKIDVALNLSDVSATHERILFTVAPEGAVQVSYKIVEKGEVWTVDEVLAEGSKVFNLKGVSNLKPKVEKSDTDYTLYVAGLSATGVKVFEQVAVRTAKASEAEDDGVLRLTQAGYGVVKTTIGGTVDVYTFFLQMESEDWSVSFMFGAKEFINEELTPGKYVLNAKATTDRPDIGGISRDYKVVNKKTNQEITNLDYGELVIGKQADGSFVITFDMMTLEFPKKVVGAFNGMPVYVKQ